MIYLILLICFAPFSYLVRFSIGGIPTSLLEILIYVCLIWCIVDYFFAKKEKFKLPQGKIVFPIIFLILAGIISVIFAPQKAAALGLFKAYIIDPIIFYYILIYYIKNKEEIGLIVKTLIVSGFLLSIFAIWQKISGQTTPDNRVLGIFVYDVSASPNFLALYLAPLVVLTFGYEIIDLKNSLKKNNYFWRVIFYNVAFISMFLALYFSASRAGIGAALIGIVTFLIIKNWLWIKERKIIVILLYCSIVLLFFLGWQMIKPNWQLSSEEGGRITSSNNIRWEIWTTTVRDIIPTGGHWLAGVGLGNYQNYFTMLTKDRVNYPEWISPWALTPHNLFLNIWVNLGLLGLVAFVWILVLFFQNTTKLPQSGLNYLLISVMIAIIVQGSLDSPLWKNDLFLLFWIFLGLIYLNKKLE